MSGSSHHRAEGDGFWISLDSGISISWADAKSGQNHHQREEQAFAALLAPLLAPIAEILVKHRAEVTRGGGSQPLRRRLNRVGRGTTICEIEVQAGEKAGQLPRVFEEIIALVTTAVERSERVITLTGSTGNLGRRLVPLLESHGHLRLLSRSNPGAREGTPWQKGDLRSGDGVYSALQGSEVVVHAASAPFKETVATDVEGTRKLLEHAAATHVRHLVYVSIVGIEKVPTDYYRAKLAAEALVKASPVPWTIVRATQFFELIDFMLGKLAPLPGVLAVPNLRFQPIDAGEVASEIARRAMEPPAGVVQLGGPQELTMRELADAWIKARREWRLKLPVGAPNAAARAIRDGGLAGAPKLGVRTWAQWLTEKYPA